MFGHSLLLSCDDVEGFPKPSITWAFNGAIYSLSENITNSTRIHISEFTEVDAGIYLCSASNGVGDTTQREFSVYGVARGKYTNRVCLADNT